MPALTSEQREHLAEFGFVAVEDVLDPENVIDPVIAEYAGVLDSLAKKLYAEGKISSTYDDLEFGERVARIYEESGEVYNGYFDFSLPQNGITADTPFWAGPAVFNALTAPGLLDAVETVVGPEIYSNPVQHVRIKVPESRAPRDEQGRVKFGVTPWHQDSGVVNPEADKTDILTVWFPLMDANVENGCLQVVPGSHTGQLLTHCPGYRDAVGVTIPTNMFDPNAAMPVPLKKGSALFMNKLTIHSSLPNVSDRIRWSFDLRYHPIGQPTGRSVFPGFIARSAAHPERELHDARQWYLMWKETRDALARSEQPKFNRWDTEDPACA
jgi:ectoine hydroxylase-related dioxygenase (phytanoyl-CoA dioxygenase family)